MKEAEPPATANQFQTDGQNRMARGLRPRPAVWYNYRVTNQPPPMAAKLLTKAIATKVPALYAQDGMGMAAIAYAKFFTPWSNWTWYLTEMDPATGQCFGLVIGLERELGYFSMADLGSTRGPAGLRIERDIHFDPCPLSACR